MIVLVIATLSNSRIHSSLSDYSSILSKVKWVINKYYNLGLSIKVKVYLYIEWLDRVSIIE